MRPRLLEITAFGPFPGTVRLDFRELESAGLFLLSGPTGAGKTSILDAMSYALFGSVPAERRIDQLRSDHADPRTETRVAFEFCLPGGDHRVTRVPPHERAKRTGTGTTQQQPKATLSRRNTGGAWTPVAEGVVEVGKLVTELLGMTAQQFSQVVVLPQGRFAEALSARPGARRNLLSSLFATERFDAYTRRLADRARETEHQVSDATAELASLHRQARERWADVVREEVLPTTPGAAAFGDTGGAADATATTGPDAPAGADPEAADATATTRPDAPAGGDPQAADATATTRPDAPAGGDPQAADATAATGREAGVTGRAGPGPDQQAAASEPTGAPGAMTGSRPPWDATDVDADLHALAAAALVAAEAARRDAEAADAAARVARVGQQRLELLAEQWRRRDEAAAVIAQLDAQAPATEEARVAVAAATRAAPLAPLVAEAVRARETAAAAVEVRRRAVEPLIAACAALPAVFAGDVREVDGWAHARPAGAAVGAARDAVRATAVRLDQLAGTWDARGEARREARVERASAARAKTRADELEAAAAQVEQRLPGLRERREAAVLAVRRLDAAREEAVALRRRAEAAAELAALRSVADEAQTVARHVAGAAVSALTRQGDLLRRRIDGMAAELAAQLRSGEACAVCGATEHPAPAPPATDGVTADDIERAAADVATAEQDALRVRQQADAARERLHAAEVAAGTAGADPALAARRADAAAAAVADDERVAAESGSLERQVDDADRALADARAEVVSARADAAAGAVRAEYWSQAAGRAEAVLRAQLGEVADPRSVTAAVGAVVARLDDVRAALDRELGAGAEALSSMETLREMAAAQGFADAADAEAALLDARDLARMAEALAATDGRRMAAAGVLAEPALRALAPRPDVGLGEAACRQAAAAAAAAARRHGRIEAAAADLQRLAGRYRAHSHALRPLAAEAQRLRHLADVCAGNGNALRMSLESYVLAAYLEEITAAASQRLVAMTDGRYTVRHSDARTRHGGASGLSIVVHDAYTGTERDTGSLSGGETFQASLALALGVADVAQRHTGGVHVDTLFVDEGFGALDPEALDAAMGELERLREGGRLVGLVSHVPWLRDRVTAGIEVVKTATGSDARVVTLAAV